MQWERWRRAHLDDLLDGMTPMEFILRFTFTNPDLDTTIVGTINPAHLQTNLDILEQGTSSDNREIDPDDVIASIQSWDDGSGIDLVPSSLNLSFIIGGYLLIQGSTGARPLGPLFISKVNTLVQIALIGFVLARLGLGFEAGWPMALLIAAAAVTTVLSGLSYLARWARVLMESRRAW